MLFLWSTTRWTVTSILPGEGHQTFGNNPSGLFLSWVVFNQPSLSGQAFDSHTFLCSFLRMWYLTVKTKCLCIYASGFDISGMAVSNKSDTCDLAWGQTQTVQPRAHVSAALEAASGGNCFTFVQFPRCLFSVSCSRGPRTEVDGMNSLLRHWKVKNMNPFWQSHGGVGAQMIPRPLILRQLTPLSVKDFKQPNRIPSTQRLGVWMQGVTCSANNHWVIFS